MAFNDQPEVDSNAIRCEESVLYVRQIFSMKNNFISREQNPDYGIDLLVELMSSSGGATSKDFAIQIKSCIESEIISINDMQFVSLEFKTSRLGHLCRRLPAYGIIVLYDIKNKIAYYDFVEDIVNRASTERNGEEWKDKTNVTIHFPITNILNQDSAKPIYELYTRRFANHDLLTVMHGSFFGIPFLSSGIGSHATKDFSDPIKFLQTYGGYLVNHNEYRFAFKLLSSIPFGRLVQSKDLLFLATIVYTQCGYYLEAKSFISFSLSKFSDWDEQQSALLEITSSRISFIMGLSTVEKFSESLDNISKRLSDDQNIAMIESQRLHLKLLFTIKKYGCIKEFVNPIIEDIKSFIDGVDNKNILKEAKLLLKLDCAYYLSEAAHFQFAHDVMQYRMQEKLMMPSSVQERLDKVKYIAELMQQTIQIAASVIEEAEKANLDTTKAHALYVICYSFFQFEFNSYILKIEINDSPKDEARSQYLKYMERIILSAHLFQKNNLLEDTHNMLCLASDTNRLYRSIYGENLSNYDEAKYLKVLEEIEKITESNS